MVFREEADQLCGEVRSLTVTLENIREERAKLVDINTDLTNQVNIWGALIDSCLCFAETKTDL